MGFKANFKGFCKNNVFSSNELAFFSIQRNLLFHSYSRQETNMISPEGLPMSNSVVYLIK
jgi:hypothetical protein